MLRSRPRPRHLARRAKLPRELQTVNLNAAGIDVGAERHYVAVPEGRDLRARTFGHSARSRPISMP
jgi:hypothetical protein